MDSTGTKTIALMIRDNAFLKYCLRNELDPVVFFPDQFDRELAKLVLELGGQYGVVTDTMLVAEIPKIMPNADATMKGLLKDRAVKVLTGTFPDLDWVAKHTEEEITLRVMQAATKKQITLLAARDIPGIRDLMKDVETRTTFNHQAPGRMREDLDAFEKYLTDMRDGNMAGIPTGIPFLDDNLFWRGLGFRELTVVLAPPKRGKTMAMLWFAYIALCNGYNVLYITLEVSKQVLYLRLGSCRLRVHIKELMQDPAGNIATLKRWLGGIVGSGENRGRPIGNLSVVDLPAKTLAAEGVRGIIEGEVRAGFQPSLVCVDYTKLMKHPATMKGWEGIGYSTEVLRGIAAEQGVAMVTGAQGKASTVSKKGNLDHDDVGYDFSQIATADLILALGKRPEEGDVTDGKPAPVGMKLQILNSRNTGAAAQDIMTAYSQGRFYVG